MLGYLGRPQEDADLYTPDGFSRSGDIGVLDADGYVRVTGRTKDIVIRGGMNISVREVEDLLGAHPAIRRLTHRPSRRRGDRYGTRHCNQEWPRDVPDGAAPARQDGVKTLTTRVKEASEHAPPGVPAAETRAVDHTHTHGKDHPWPTWPTRCCSSAASHSWR